MWLDLCTDMRWLLDSALLLSGFLVAELPERVMGTTLRIVWFSEVLSVLTGRVVACLEAVAVFEAGLDLEEL